MYNGAEKVPQTSEWRLEIPFYYDGITYDEYFIEWYYFDSCNTLEKKLNYKPLRKQLEDGDITSIPNSYKALCPEPDKCTAFNDLLKIA